MDNDTTGYLEASPLDLTFKSNIGRKKSILCPEKKKSVEMNLYIVVFLLFPKIWSLVNVLQQMIVPYIETKGRGSALLKRCRTASFNCLIKAIAMISASKCCNISHMFQLKLHIRRNQDDPLRNNREI